MIDAKMIPDEARKAIYDLFPPGYLESIGLHPESIAAAALNAWPWAKEENRFNVTLDGKPITVTTFILPLPKDGE